LGKSLVVPALLLHPLLLPKRKRGSPRVRGAETQRKKEIRKKVIHEPPPLKLWHVQRHTKAGKRKEGSCRNLK